MVVVLKSSRFRICVLVTSEVSLRRRCIIIFYIGVINIVTENNILCFIRIYLNLRLYDKCIGGVVLKGR